jgi:aspartyl protease family protein
VITRQEDGHFYVKGEVNHKEVTFLVDTGASDVAVSYSFARSAGLPRGKPAVFSTANGPHSGYTIFNIPVKAGPLVRNDITMSTGPTLDEDDSNALLGQSFLKHYRMEINGNKMILQPLNQVP